MEISASNPKFSSHVRSLSFPSTSHPLIAGAEEQLQRFKSSESQSASQKLDGLKTLYQCLDDVLQLSQSQHLLSQESTKWEEEVLDGSLMLLDVCGSIRDIFLQKKESIQELESSLRRKRGGELETYMASKKDLNKLISKCHKGLKKADKKNNTDIDTICLVNLINGIQEVSFKVLDASLSSVSSKPTTGWSLVSKVLKHKRESGKGDSDDVEKMEAEALRLLNDNNSNQEVQNILQRLEALNLSFQELAEALETVYRLLLKTRVSLLNSLNH